MAASGWSRSRPSGSNLVRSYGGDLRKWAGGIARRCAVAVAVLIIGVFTALVAVGFGIAAVFHFVELRYGPNVAFASVGGFFAVIGLVGVFVGGALLKRQMPPVPRPHRQVQELKRALAGPATLHFIRSGRQASAIAKDPVMQFAIGAAAALVIGWIASTGLARSNHAEKM